VTFTRTWTRVAALGSALSFVLAMGLSRVFLGHHWLTDVVAGWLLGLFWVIVVVTGHRLKVTLDRSSRREDQVD
jgi:membrane-associated phospholipid phosphatase